MYLSQVTPRPLPGLFLLALVGCASYEMELIAGDLQGAAAGRMLDTPVDVFVTKLSSSTTSTGSGEPEPSGIGGPAIGVDVNFEVTAGGGSVDRETAATDDNGRAVVAWTVGDVGPQELTVTVGETKITQVLTATAFVTGEFTDDRDGTTYRTVTAGGLTWMADHLRFDIVGSRVDPNQSDVAFGRLYTYPAANLACPPGWRLPSSDDYLGFADALAPGDSQGRRMRNDTGWIRLNGEDGNGSNSSAFNLLPTGYSDVPDFFSGEGAEAHLWTSTEPSDVEAQVFTIRGDEVLVVPQTRAKIWALSVRCVTDA
jgi:uncharacterized protein (TIGR02145 family)